MSEESKRNGSEYLPEGWRFGTDGIRGEVTSKMRPIFMTTVAMAAGRAFKEDGINEILIGKDTRISGYMIESALQAGFISVGLNVVLLGPVPTPAVSFLTKGREAACGVVISASHNTYLDNGLKFFNSEGEKISSKLERKIEHYILEDYKVSEVKNFGRASRLTKAQSLYSEFCKSTVPDLNLSNINIVVDCANGANYKIAPTVFSELGANVIKIGCSPNGKNINKDCGSTSPEYLSESVLKYRADLGIAFDGDGDRLAMVDKEGSTLDGDDLIYLFFQKEENIKKFQNRNGVVGTHMTNMSLELFFKKNNIDFFRADIGDKYVHQELENRGWTLGGESSGHIMFLDDVSSGDALVASLKILDSIQEKGFNIKKLMDSYYKFPQELINLKVKDPNLCLLSQNFMDSAKKNETKLNASGRILIRPSGTEPVLRIMVEGEQRDLVDKVIKDMINTVKELGLG